MTEHEAWCVFNGRGEPCAVAWDEAGAVATVTLFAGRHWQYLENAGYKIRRVRIVEIPND